MNKRIEKGKSTILYDNLHAACITNEQIESNSSTVGLHSSNKPTTTLRAAAEKKTNLKESI